MERERERDGNIKVVKGGDVLKDMVGGAEGGRCVEGHGKKEEMDKVGERERGRWKQKGGEGRRCFEGRGR